jgi:rRNA-processing protein FCF1
MNNDVSSSPCKKALVDTSILIYFVEQNIDLLELFLQDEICQLVITTHVLEELKYMATTAKGDKSRKARVALEVLREKISLHPALFALRYYPFNLPTDDLLVEVAASGRYIILTADKILKNKAAKRGIDVLFLRKSSKKLT